jgi:hypothetical protein
MWTTIECAGHPRDMGLAQGTALATAIRAELARAGLPLRRSRWPDLRGLTSGPVRGAGAGRELFRHFAHQAERLEGLAQRADVPVDSVLQLHLRLRAGGVAGGLVARRASLRTHDAVLGGGRERASAEAANRARAQGSDRAVLLERTLPAALPGEAGWIVRESRPAVGFGSVEITLPWLVSSVAGVNEAGLSIVAGPMLWGRAGLGGQAPSILLVQECLQRFPDLAGALDWCRKRPVEGEQAFVLADASGAVATVTSTDRERRIQTGSGEIDLEAGELPNHESAAMTHPGRTVLGTDRVLLDPLRRSLRVEAEGLELEVVARDAGEG